MAFKHGSREDLAFPLGFALGNHWLATRAKAAAIDLWVPVPIHRLRKWQRGYDQAAVLAGVLGEVTGIPVRPILYRKRPTAPQGTLYAGKRMSNVREVFAVHPEWAPLIQGRRIALVDDVCTSGATLAACAKVLRRSGAAYVEGVCIARA